MTTAESAEADFTMLDGIGTKTAEALRATGLTTMDQLAKTSVAKLVARLERVGASVPESRIISQRWLFQAWEHGQSSSDQAASEPPARSLRPTTEQPVTEQEPEVAEQPWVEHASYIVFFDRRGDGEFRQWQTRVWDTTAMAEEVVAGTDPSTWLSLITDRADVPL